MMQGVHVKLNPELPWQKSIQQHEDSFHQQIGLNLRKNLEKCYIWSIALYGAETWTLQKVDQKYLESFGMWFWKKMEIINWIDHVRNEAVLYTVKQERNNLHEIQ
jgi:hypothetical protein